MTFKKIIQIIGCNILLLIFLIMVFEWIASFFHTKLGQNVIPHYRLNHIWKPNSKYVHSEWIRYNPEFPVPYTHYYNRQGWLETYDVAKVKPPNTYRIFYLGDSFTEGTCPMEQSVPSLIETRLNELFKGNNINFEVINTGTSSYSPTLCYILLRHVLIDNYSPDMVVLMVDMTDYFDDLKYGQTLVCDEKGNPWACPPHVLNYSAFVDSKYHTFIPTWRLKLQLWLASHSYIYNLMLTIRERQIVSHSFQKSEINPVSSPQPIMDWPWAWCQRDWNITVRKNVDYTLDMISRIAVLCRQHHIKLMITSVPHYWQYAGKSDGMGLPLWSDRPHKEIARLAERQNVPYLNSYLTLRPFIQGTPQYQYYYFGDMHFNPMGYKLWADIHLDFITDEKNKLLPKSLYECMKNNRK